jgi:amino acid transporter
MFLPRLFTFAVKWINREPNMEIDYTDLSSEQPEFVANRLSGQTNIGDFIVSMINGVLFFLFVITLLAVIIGGFSWILAMGNEEKVGKARKTILYAIIGMIIIISSYAIVATVTGNIENPLPYLSPPTLTD